MRVWAIPVGQDVTATIFILGNVAFEKKRDAYDIPIPDLWSVLKE
jgi:hypothetical protein